MTSFDMNSSKTNTSRKGNGVFSGIINLGFVISNQLIATLVVLHYDSGDCTDNSLRTWLKVCIAINAVNAILNLVVEIFLLDKVGKSIVYIVFYLVFSVFSLVWMIIGTVWYYNNPTCGTGKLQSDFPNGYALVYVMVILFFIALGLIACCCTCIVGSVCVSACVANKADQD